MKPRDGVTVYTMTREGGMTYYVFSRDEGAAPGFPRHPCVADGGDDGTTYYFPLRGDPVLLPLARALRRLVKEAEGAR